MKCVQCSRNISPNATTCPGCGEPDPTINKPLSESKKNTGDGCGFIIFAFFFFLIFFSFVYGPGNVAEVIAKGLLMMLVLIGRFYCFIFGGEFPI